MGLQLFSRNDVFCGAKVGKILYCQNYNKSRWYIIRFTTHCVVLRGNWKYCFANKSFYPTTIANPYSKWNIYINWMFINHFLIYFFRATLNEILLIFWYVWKILKTKPIVLQWVPKIALPLKNGSLSSLKVNLLMWAYQRPSFYCNSATKEAMTSNWVHDANTFWCGYCKNYATLCNVISCT